MSELLSDSLKSLECELAHVKATARYAHAALELAVSRMDAAEVANLLITLQESKQ